MYKRKGEKWKEIRNGMNQDERKKKRADEKKEEER